MALCAGHVAAARAEAMPDVIEVVLLATIDLSMNLSALVAIAAFAGFWQARTTINPLQPERASVLVTHGILPLHAQPHVPQLLLLLVAYASTWERGWPLPARWLRGLHHPLQILPEERVLLSKFAPEYDAYRRRYAAGYRTCTPTLKLP